MLSYEDFAPKFVRQSGLLNSLVGAVEFETFDEAVEAANEWIVEHAVKVINVETVVLPNLWESHEEGSADADLRTTGGHTTNRWHQFVRVWYEG